ncbi:MAG: NAD(P)-binding domain-containing protein [Chloroflexi bacterium]|nr:NAD(P)-binding domain-containing protein [Chloroflexota bacterium]
MKAQNISIVGLGRLGASIGLAVQQSSLDVRVVGHDRNADVARLALSMGAVTKLEMEVQALAAKADILVLAVPLCGIRSAAGGHRRSGARTYAGFGFNAAQGAKPQVGSEIFEAGALCGGYGRSVG